MSRAKASADPLFVRSYTVHRGRAIDLEGKRLSELLPRLEREVLDAEVELSFQRRVYNGRRPGDAARFRLVAVWDEKHRQYHTYLTNIGPEVLSAEEVASLYRMRWEFELTFKEWKSQYALDAFRTTNADVVEALIWAALLTLVASRRLYHLVRARAPPELLPRHTPMMWSIEFREGASATLGCRLAHLGYEEFSEKEWHDVNHRLTVCALTSHIRRPPVREVWST